MRSEKSMKKNILIVEDDSVLQKTMQEYLQMEGFVANVASDGDEAMKLAKELKPDLILLDIVLPKKDGYEIIQEVRADDVIGKVPIMLLTNLGGINDVEKALGLGATTYLVKADYTLEEVANKVKELLGLE